MTPNVKKTATSAVLRIMKRSPFLSLPERADRGSWFLLYVIEAVALQFALDKMRDLDPVKTVSG